MYNNGSMKHRTKTILEYNVLFTKEPEGGYSVSVPDLPGCHSQGDTFEEAEANIKEAIHLCLNVARDDKEYASKIALKTYAASVLA